MTVDDAHRRAAGAREWAGLAVLTLAVLMITFDMFVLLLALPGLSADLRPGTTEQLWILDIYGFMVGGFLVTMGMLGDRIGRRKLLMTGAACFAVASLASAFATSPEMLIVLRALLGVAGATLAPSTLALISVMFRDPRQRGVAVGVWAAGFTVGAMLGPVVGGVLLAHFWWGSVFLLAVPVMVLLLVLCPILVPEFKNPEVGRPDLISVALSLGAMLAMTYTLKQVARHGWEVVPVLVGVAGAGLGVLFVRRQGWLAEPILDPALFRNRSFSVMLIGLLLFGIVGAASMVFITQFLQSVSGMTPLRAALCLVPGMVVAAFSSTVSPMLGRRLRPAYLIGWGVLGVAVAYALFTQLDASSSPVVLIVGFGIIGLCEGPLLALGVNLVVDAVPVEKASSSSSMAQIANEAGASLGVAIMGSVGAAVYVGNLTSSMPPGVPGPAAIAAEESLASAVAVAPSLPEQQAGELLAVARDAFTDGMNVFAAISVGILVLVAILVMALLRHVPPTGQEKAATDVSPEELTAG
ncbi:MFS transporter [Amycolatopsis cihanbeyliensis]|uniref:DHA2 family multidrug resistance protein-like MFS transporter n=1 Tax=Amycolatopsis cihanbeyliensis TaxID=1128664 RepID=A0A542DQC4_AMYCI|nr:MFS transporter [Amycolatopsis cihanbeyliensis]TQJ05267.1 DHA2 family multidrug resistance protein-like MFS transporter [Amycolatopsis cihanbeyliensis]